MSEHTISRRGLVGASAAAGLGAAIGRIPGAAAAGLGTKRRKCDVVVVGAGFAGLTAARELIGRAAQCSCSRLATASAAVP